MFTGILTGDGPVFDEVAFVLLFGAITENDEGIELRPSFRWSS
jgi:hypothetical protein